ncbi:Dbl (DH) domain [Trinorchestia longiramus]|nr:Dbl (DH) domain [Trinorchestia longiramus]
MEARMERNASFTAAPSFQPPPPSLQETRRCLSESVRLHMQCESVRSQRHRKQQLQALYHRKQQLQALYHRKLQLRALYHRKQQLRALHHRKQQLQALHHRKQQLRALYHRKQQLRALYHRKQQLRVLYHRKQQLRSLYHRKQQLRALYHRRPLLAGTSLKSLGSAAVYTALSTFCCHRARMVGVQCDVDVDSGLKDNDSGSSSNSSLSLSLDSPSLEQVSGRDSSQLLCPQLNNDSDVEAEADLPDWSSNVPADQLAGLPSRERKRQDTINELFHTEQTHVRMLKVMYSLFYNPLMSSGLLTDEQLTLLFPNLNTMLEIHSSFNKAMKKRRREQPLVQTIGDILTGMFEGPQGETFGHEAAVFVRSQSIGLEGLKLSKKRDQKLASFLQERENHPYCRRLQLKDMLPAGFQRLSKYPLLLESLLGYTDLDKYPEEYEQINRCLIRAKEILASVNAAVREEENHQRLIEIQRRLDQSSMVKNKHGHVSGVKGNLDLTKHRLIYEGPLTWRLSKSQKNVDLHVLVLEKFIVLLQKDSDKYVLKNYSLNKASIKEDSSHSPIIKFGAQFLYRAVATDNCAFFIVTTQCGPAQIYELVTSSPNDRKVIGHVGLASFAGLSCGRASNSTSARYAACTVLAALYSSVFLTSEVVASRKLLPRSIPARDSQKQAALLRACKRNVQFFAKACVQATNNLHVSAKSWYLLQPKTVHDLTDTSLAVCVIANSSRSAAHAVCPSGALEKAAFSTRIL